MTIQESEMQREEDERLSVDFLESLTDFVDNVEVKELNIDMSNEAFEITNREQAGFFIRKLQEIREEMDRVNKEAAKETERLQARINAWKEQELKRCQGGEAYMLALLESFAAKELDGTDKKSLKLPYGTLAFTKQQDKFEYDDDALLACLKANNFTDYVRTKEEPNKSELKKVAQVKGDKLYYNDKELDGVTVTPQPTKFSVK